MSETKHIRWKATIVYRSDAGSVDVDHDLHELADVDDFVERGPHWDTIEKIEIVTARADKFRADMTRETKGDVKVEPQPPT